MPCLLNLQCCVGLQIITQFREIIHNNFISQCTFQRDLIGHQGKNSLARRNYYLQIALSARPARWMHKLFLTSGAPLLKLDAPFDLSRRKAFWKFCSDKQKFKLATVDSCLPCYTTPTPYIQEPCRASYTAVRAGKCSYRFTVWDFPNVYIDMVHQHIIIQMQLAQLAKQMGTLINQLKALL